MGISAGRWCGFGPRDLAERARTAAQEFGLVDARMVPFGRSENAIWRVQSSGRRVALRAHRPQSSNLASLPALNAEQIQSELRWLRWLGQRASFPVPQPIACPDGRLLIELPGGDGSALCWTALEWIRGRKMSGRLLPEHMPAVGRLMAELHLLSREMPDSAEYRRPSWDIRRVDRALREIQPLRDEGVLSEELWRLLANLRERIDILTHRIGRRRDTWGLIHADVTPENLLFDRLRPGLIDFCSSGFGYYLYDIAQFMFPAPGDDYWKRFFEGYCAVRPLPDGAMERARGLTAMSFIFWLNSHAPTRLQKIRPRLPKFTARVRELTGID